MIGPFNFNRKDFIERVEALDKRFARAGFDIKPWGGSAKEVVLTS